jgi:hypothetical protein
MLAAPKSGGPCPAQELGILPPIRDVLSRLAETPYIGFGAVAQCGGAKEEVPLRHAVILSGMTEHRFHPALAGRPVMPSKNLSSAAPKGQHINKTRRPEAIFAFTDGQ